MLWKTKKVFKDLFARYQALEEMWGVKACSLLFCISSVWASLKKKGARRDGIVKQKIPVVKLQLWSSRRAGEPLRVAAHCLMASRTAEAKRFSWWEGTATGICSLLPCSQSPYLGRRGGSVREPASQPERCLGVLEGERGCGTAL